MSWVKRGNNRYYYRSVRRGGRVSSVYLGDGLAAVATAMHDEAAAQERAARRAAHAESRRLSDSVEQCVAPIGDLATALHDACLLLSGHHRDYNLKWRRMRERKPMSSEDAEAQGMDAGPGEGGRENPAGAARASQGQLALSQSSFAGVAATSHALGEALRSGIPPGDLAEFIGLVQRIDHGRPSPEDLVELEWALAAHPGIWRVIADYGRAAIDAMLEQLEPSPAVRLAFVQGAEELRAGLANAGASALERAIAEQITVCWVRVRAYETWLNGAIGQGDEALIRFWDERVSSAQRRFLAACRELAVVRQLAARTPALLQINVAGQQINVARAGGDGGSIED